MQRKARAFRQDSGRTACGIAFASALLSRGVPITYVDCWMGHEDIRETFARYTHFVAEAEGQGIAVLDAEYAEWSGPIGSQGTRGLARR